MKTPSTGEEQRGKREFWKVSQRNKLGENMRNMTILAIGKENMG